MSEPGNCCLLTLRCPRAVDRGAIRSFLKRVTTEITSGRPFTVLLTDDRELRRLNRQFLGKDYATDVLSFPAPPGVEGLGDIAISVERAAGQAREHGHSTGEEIAILILHGVLHLLGMDHETDRGAMRRSEARWRRKLGLPAGLVERAGQ